MSGFGPTRLDTSPDAPFEVCVVGGGPAGAALALRLAQLGRRVAIAEKAVFPRPHIGEAITAGALPLFEALGIRSAVESAGALRSELATVAWAGELRRFRPHGGPGMLVDRARFDALLLNTASAMPGVRRYQPARVVRAKREEKHWVIALHTGEVLRASYLAEASGRAHVLPRSRRRLGAPTLALYAYFRGAPGGDPAETWVEAGASAWYWGSPVPGGEFNATVFVDPGPSADYEALVRASKLLGPRLGGAHRASEIRTCDATAFADRSPVSSTFIKVGDAALSLDPLSSQGVETAIGTALHAAVVLNTLLDRPEDTDLAIEFYRSRIARSGDFHAAAAADLYRRQAALDDGEFWSRRASAGSPRSARAALAPGSIVALAPHLQFAPVAIAGERHLARHDGVRLSGSEYAFVGDGLSIAPLLRAIDGPLLAMEVVRRWSRSLPPRHALTVLEWAFSEGLVCLDRGASSRGPSNEDSIAEAIRRELG
jgi:2-polyprenyl-6-methoxyphenol hydroxylase-like FAD-dependent oxidoreductase